MRVQDVVVDYTKSQATSNWIIITQKHICKKTALLTSRTDPIFLDCPIHPVTGYIDSHIQTLTGYIERTICFFVLYVNESVLQTAPTHGIPAPYGVSLGDLT